MNESELRVKNNGDESKAAFLRIKCCEGSRWPGERYAAERDEMRGESKERLFRDDREKERNNERKRKKRALSEEGAGREWKKGGGD